MPREMESRMREMEDREAIKELRHLYSYHVDQGKMAECAALYSDDAVADFGPLGVFRGRDQVRGFYCEYLPANFVEMRHYVHNHVIRLAGDRGDGECYFEVKLISREGKGFSIAGRYDDEFVRVGGQWKFKARRVTFDYFLPDGESWAQKTRMKLDAR
jgi:SnoaL-like protein